MSLAVEFWEDLHRQCSVITGLATPPGDSFSVKLFFQLGRANCDLGKCRRRRRERRKALAVRST